MNTLRPFQLLLIGSAFVAFCVVIGLRVLDAEQLGLTRLELFYVFLGTFGATYLVFYLLIKRFLNDRLRLLFRSIRKGKFDGEKPISFKITDDIISKAELETVKWTNEKNNEISKLREQEEFRREFLGNLAHELKTPVFAIQGYILTLLDGGLEDEKVNTMFLERASKATDRMADILNDLDQITKMEVDALKLDLKNFDIIELVQDIFDTIDIKAKDKNITVELSKKYNPIFVLADRTKIGQVITNLISNSINYGNEGGKTTVRLFVLDDTVTVEIADNGPGIEEQHMPRLFERFYRVEKSRNRHQGGSGLGLSIVKHILESHQQSINVRSTVGIGSTFAFTLAKGKLNNKEASSQRGHRH